MRKHCLALVLGLAMIGSHALAQPRSDEDVIAAMEQTWIRATAVGDKETVGELLDDSYVERTPSGATRTKKDVLQAPPPSMTSTQDLDDLIVVVRGDTASVNGTDRYRAAPGATPVDYVFVDTFRKREGVWRIVRSQMARRGGELSK
jgi:hypothetical protein